MVESGSSGEPGSPYCTQCGASLPVAARFCTKCGRATENRPKTVDAAALSAPRTLAEQLPALTVLTLFLAVGLVIWLVVLRPGIPTSSAPSRSPAATGAGMMPPGHPPITLSEEVKANLDSLAAKAEAAPDDAGAWRTLAQHQASAAEVDPTYGQRAIDSYQRVLKLAPDDLDAVRQLGNLHYNRQQFAAAAEQYERYLKAQPDDAAARTSLGTSYLFQRQIDRAIDSYNTVIEKNPDFIQAHLSIALAYQTKGETEKALAALAKARGLARDDAGRAQIDRIAEQFKNEQAGGGQAPAAAGARAGTQPAGTRKEAGDVASTFREEVEAALRAHPMIGPRIRTLEWPEALAARVQVSDFPIKTMPDFARDLLHKRLETIIQDAKEKSGLTADAAIELVDSKSGESLEQATR